jgi:hypothetical protein
MRWAILALIFSAAATAHCGPLSAGEHRSRTVTREFQREASLPLHGAYLRAAPVPATGKSPSRAAVLMRFGTCNGRRSRQPVRRTGGNGRLAVASVVFSRRHAAARNASAAGTARVPAPAGFWRRSPSRSECAGIGDSDRHLWCWSVAARAQRSLRRLGRASSPADRTLNQWWPARGRQRRDVAWC